ncbi:MAG: cellulase N-terminal Ig-like domain-containing protein, partial [Muribaculaceae bacterium]
MNHNHLITKAAITAVAALCVNTVNAQSLRVNQVGYLSEDLKVAVYVGNVAPSKLSFELASADFGILPVDSVVEADSWAPMKYAARIYFSSVTTSGNYVLTCKLGSQVAEVTSLYICDDAYSRFAINEL